MRVIGKEKMNEFMHENEEKRIGIRDNEKNKVKETVGGRKKKRKERRTSNAG